MYIVLVSIIPITVRVRLGSVAAELHKYEGLILGYFEFSQMPHTRCRVRLSKTLFFLVH